MITYKTIGEIVKITKGKKVDFSDKGEKGYIDIGILRTNQIVQYTNDNGVECNENDILIAWDGSKSGTIGYGLNGIIGSTLAKLEVTEKDIYTPYVGEFLKSKFDYLNTYTSGAAIPHIRKEVLIGIEIPLPPLETQKAIVAKLDQIFAELDQTKSEIQNNLDNTDELWKSVLNQAFQGDWEVKKLGEVIKLVSGQDLTTKEYNSEGQGIPYITGASNIENETVIINRWTDKPKSIAKKGDLLITCKGTVGTMAILNEDKVHIARQIMAIQNENPTTILYIKLFLETYIQKLKASANGLIPGIARNTILSIEIPVPPLSEQEKIVEHLDQVSKEVKELKSKYQSQLDNLEELKKSVLDKAFKGELVE